MKNKASQIKMTETIAILFVFFIIVFIAVNFYMKMELSNSEKRAKEKADINAIEISLSAANLPELQCSNENIVTPNCIDKYKLLALKSILENPANKDLRTDHYFNIFGYSSIALDKIYPADTTNYPITLYSKTYEPETSQTSEQKVNSISTFNPILICDAVDETCSFGVLNVTHYSKQ